MTHLQPTHCMTAFILVLLAVGWVARFDEFSINCSRQQGYILKHAGNKYCVRHTAILDSKMRKR